MHQPVHVLPAKPQGIPCWYHLLFAAFVVLAIAFGVLWTITFWSDPLDNDKVKTEVNERVAQYLQGMATDDQQKDIVESLTQKLNLLTQEKTEWTKQELTLITITKERDELQQKLFDMESGRQGSGETPLGPRAIPEDKSSYWSTIKWCAGIALVTGLGVWFYRGSEIDLLTTDLNECKKTDVGQLQTELGQCRTNLQGKTDLNSALTEENSTLTDRIETLTSDLEKCVGNASDIQTDLDQCEETNVSLTDEKKQCLAKVAELEELKDCGPQFDNDWTNSPEYKELKPKADQFDKIFKHFPTTNIAGDSSLNRQCFPAAEVGDTVTWEDSFHMDRVKTDVTGGLGAAFRTRTFKIDEDVTATIKHTGTLAGRVDGQCFVTEDLTGLSNGNMTVNGKTLGQKYSSKAAVTNRLGTTHRPTTWKFDVNTKVTKS